MSSVSDEDIDGSDEGSSSAKASGELKARSARSARSQKSKKENDDSEIQDSAEQAQSEEASPRRSTGGRKRGSLVYGVPDLEDGHHHHHHEGEHHHHHHHHHDDDSGAEDDPDEDYGDFDTGSEEEGVDQEDWPESGDEQGDDEGIESASEDEVSSISNETEVSDPVVIESKRQTAQVLPDVPWSDMLRNCRQCAIALFLPVVLVLLLIYGLLKCVQAFLRLLIDIGIVVKQLISLAVRVSLSPLYILWTLLLPKVVRNAITKEYDRRLGKRLHKIRKVIKKITWAIYDIPNVGTACGSACIETCFYPAKRCFGSMCWQYFGKYIHTYVAQPLIDSHINHTIRRRRYLAGLSKRETDQKKKMSQNENKGSRRKREMIERQKRLKAKKKLAQLEIVLSVEVTGSGQKKEQRVQLMDKARNQLLSRTMIMERRYGIAVGFVWCVIGSSLLVFVLDGTKDETCTLCQENPELGVKVCRHGRGRDCAFFYHTDQTFIAVGIIAVGAMLMAYSIFLYRPQRMAEDKLKKEKEKEAEDEKRELEMTHKPDDPEIQAIHNLQEDMHRPTLPRLVYRCYKATPLYVIIKRVSYCIELMGRALVRCEQRLKIREGSVNFQHAIYLLCGGWVARAWRHIMDRYNFLAKKIYASEGAYDLSQFERGVVGFICFWQIVGGAFSSTPCGRPIARRVQRTDLWRGLAGLYEEMMTVHKGGPNRSVLQTGASESSRRNTRLSRSTSTLQRTQSGSGGLKGKKKGGKDKPQETGKVRTMEEVLRSLGLDDAADEAEEEMKKVDEEAHEAQEEQEEDGYQRRMEELITGLTEEVREAGYYSDMPEPDLEPGGLIMMEENDESD
eukprot:TRINITY_DN12111_c0_g2_i1.p1 TRINITY_DN12111_c0_g2~~TRINITY_DN12111_c0_g2_i1.p1  ORF type:complete len:846 (+),score=195.21 TRINITY_DN12111_c0_g2_i1:207-2744(+)